MKLGSCGDPAAAEGCPEEKAVTLCIKKTFRKKNIENFSKMV